MAGDAASLGSVPSFIAIGVHLPYLVPRSQSPQSTTYILKQVKGVLSFLPINDVLIIGSNSQIPSGDSQREGGMKN